MKSSLHYLDTNRSARQTGRYARANLEPEISVPVPVTTWLSLSLTAGGHLTWYGDSLITGQERQAAMTDTDFRGEDLMRLVPTARAEVIGPGLSRIFDLAEGRRFSRMKHVIEPRVVYAYFDDFEDRLRIPLFDELDILRGRNVARFSLFNRPARQTGRFPSRAAPSRSSRSSSSASCRSTARSRCCTPPTAP